jgi:threonylcarbamoyladenosine tRNA methylthiotransferase MtaB
LIDVSTQSPQSTKLSTTNLKLNKFLSTLPTLSTFSTVNFGCRVNAAETNLISQYFLNLGLTPAALNPDLIFVNTCAITQKGEYESLSRLRRLRALHPNAFIISSGCAGADTTAGASPTQHLHTNDPDPNLLHLTNLEKEDLLDALHASYTPHVGDKFSRSHRFLLKVQSGCRHHCSYCIVPTRRPYSRFLPISEALHTANTAHQAGYTELILTGVNLLEYTPGFSTLLESLLTHTQIPLFSFGSVALNCLDDKFLGLYERFPTRLSLFLHVPLQSGSDRILKLMGRPYTQKHILETLTKYNSSVVNISFGTDIIVGFPSETEQDFQDTLTVCQKINFKKIHTFRFSPRPGTKAALLWRQSPVPPSVVNARSRLIRNL